MINPVSATIVVSKCCECSLHTFQRSSGVSGPKNRNMADVCSLSKKGFLDCGSLRGRSETVFLYECRDDLTTHLKNCFLSRADLKEYEVILQRAGFECLSHEQVKKLPFSSPEAALLLVSTKNRNLWPGPVFE